MNNPYPSPWLRVAAIVFDIVLTFALILASGSIERILGIDGDRHYLSVLLLLIYMGYQFTILIKNGQTIGKKVCRIKIVRWVDGEVGGFTQTVVLRRILGIFDITLIVPIVDFMMMIANGNHRSLHDIVAGTIVVNSDCNVRPMDLPVYEKNNKAMSIVLGTILVIFVPVFSLGGLILYSLYNEFEPQKRSYSDKLMSIDYSSNFSKSAKAKDSTCTVSFVNFATTVEYKILQTSKTTEIPIILQYAFIKDHLEGATDSIVFNDTITQYGRYNAVGREYRAYYDDICFTAKFCEINEENLYCRVFEIFPDISAYSDKKVLAMMEESFVLNSEKSTVE